MDRKKLDITFLLPNSGVGGGVRAVMRFGNSLIQMGHNVRIFYRSPKGIKITTRKIYNRLRYGQAKDWLDDFNGVSAPYIKLNPREFKEDELVISMCAQTTFDACSLPEGIGIKVLHCHGVQIENWEYMLSSWKLPTYKISISSHIVDIIKKEIGENTIGVVPNGVDGNEYFPTCDISARNAVGGTVRWSPSKDPETTINIFKKIHEEIPCAGLLTFGPDRKPKVLDFVHFTRGPAITNAREIYSSCNIWFLASKSEGFGLPVLEAMACGCVVVSTRCGGPEDIIKDGVNGFLVDIGDVDNAVDIVKKVWIDKKLQKLISQKAIKTASEYSWENGANMLEGFLQQIYKKENFMNRHKADNK